HRCADAQAPDDYWLDAAAAQHGVQRLYRPEPAREDLAAHRGGPHQAAGLQDFPARAGRRGPSPDGVLAAHRQDRPYRLAASAFSHSIKSFTSARPAAAVAAM